MVHGMVVVIVSLVINTIRHTNTADLTKRNTNLDTTSKIKSSFHLFKQCIVTHLDSLRTVPIQQITLRQFQYTSTRSSLYVYQDVICLDIQVINPCSIIAPEKKSNIGTVSCCS